MNATATLAAIALAAAFMRDASFHALRFKTI